MDITFLRRVEGYRKTTIAPHFSLEERYTLVSSVAEQVYSAKMMNKRGDCTESSLEKVAHCELCACEVHFVLKWGSIPEPDSELGQIGLIGPI